ncbi:MAG: GGDEF domain-containing protein [Brevinematales bacterium]|jgi:diguanylate cyclase (GGDEF)-like protein
MKANRFGNVWINIFISRLFTFRRIVLPAISILILGIIILLSYLFILNERDAIIKKTEEMCVSTAAGLSSAAVEAIIQNKRGLVNDYISDLKTFSIEGLDKTYVIEYLRNKGKDRINYSGTIIGSLDYRDIGKHLSESDIRKYLAVKGLKLNVMKINGRNYYVYYYPVVWKLTVKGKVESYPLGMIVIEFLETKILKTFYSAMTVTLSISIMGFLLTLFLVGMYMILTFRLEKTLEKVRLLSVTDELTRIYNRKKFNEVFNDEIRKFKRYGRPLSLIMFDIDHFKKVNDTYGHETGDSILSGVVSVIKPMVRQTDLFARWGGEEFMILTPDTGKAGASEFAERIRVRISSKNFAKVGNLTCSFGVSTFESAETGDDMLRRVDQALYEAKENGRNRVITL